MNTKQILQDALDILNERGHHKGGYLDDETGAVCALGALNLVCLGDARHTPNTIFTDNIIRDAWFSAFTALGGVLESEGFDAKFTNPVSAFNDARVTTEEDVKLLFKKAIHNQESD